MARKVYMVDTENVSSSWRMMLADMTRNDVLYLFYTEHSPGIGYADFKEIMESEIQPEMISCYPGKNGLDFQLVSYLGYLLKSAGKTEYIIISNDMGYDSVIHFWTDQGYKVSRITVYDLIQRKKARIAQQKMEETAMPEKPEKETVAVKEKNNSREITATGNNRTEDNKTVIMNKEKQDTESMEINPQSAEDDKKEIASKGIMDISSGDIYVFGNSDSVFSESDMQGKQMEMPFSQTSEPPKKRGRKKKNVVEEPAVLEQSELSSKVSAESEEDMGRQLLSDLLEQHEDIDVDTVIEILRHGSIHQLQKIYTQMLKLFGHQTGVELYHVLKPHFSVLFTYAKKGIQS